MDLKSVTYVSRASLDFTESDLIAILATARHTNALEGITGLLVFNGVKFLQIVEGSEAAVDGLIDRLRDDPRHTGLEVRDERWVARRSFPEWSMELAEVDTEVLTSRTGLDSLLPDGVDPAVRDLILRNTVSLGGSVRLPN